VYLSLCDCFAMGCCANDVEFSGHLTIPYHPITTAPALEWL
jgi:hypothetical protein